MNIEERYQTIMHSLRENGRGLTALSALEIEELTSLLLQKNGEELTKVLCIVSHASHAHRDFEIPLLQRLQMAQQLPAEQILWLLSCVRKHIVTGRLKEGIRLSHEFLESLRPLLQYKERDVVEWTLRTIEECGAQGIVFKQDFSNIKPSGLSLMRAQNRTIFDLIELMQGRWRAFEKR